MTITLSTPICWRFPRRILKDYWSHRFRWYGFLLVGWTRLGDGASEWAHLSLSIGRGEQS